MKRVVYFILLGCMIIQLAGCDGSKSNVRLKDINFENEIFLDSGRLQTTKSDLMAAKMEEAATLPFRNNVLRWGIARKPNNQTPQADPGSPDLLAKYGAKYMGDITKKVIYLTYDEGYENGYTPMILDALKTNKVKAIFFITMPYLKEHEDLVKRMVDEGHEIGNHTVHHPSLPKVGDKELEEELGTLSKAFKEKFNKEMVFLRPPMGEYSERTLYLSNKLGYCNLFWSFAYDDWHRDVHKGAEYALNMVDKNLHNGAVLLLHAVSKDNAQAMDGIIKNAKSKGYEFGDPNELLDRTK